jgi:hypothetical protein
VHPVPVYWAELAVLFVPEPRSSMPDRSPVRESMGFVQLSWRQDYIIAAGVHTGAKLESESVSSYTRMLIVGAPAFSSSACSRNGRGCAC